LHDFQLVILELHGVHPTSPVVAVPSVKVASVSGSIGVPPVTI